MLKDPRPRHSHWEISVLYGLNKLVGQDVLPLLVYSGVRWQGHFQDSTERALDMLIVILAEFQAP
jgi:hypothetical protein